MKIRPAPRNGILAMASAKVAISNDSVLPCQPCHRPVCRINDHRCMRDIPASDVVAIANRVLNEVFSRYVPRALRWRRTVITKSDRATQQLVVL
jgi:hypothetical protein